MARSNDDISIIPTKVLGRPLVLGDLDALYRSTLGQCGAVGTPISATLIIAAAQSIIEPKDRTLGRERMVAAFASLEAGYITNVVTGLYVKRAGTTQAKRHVVKNTGGWRIRLCQMARIIDVHKISHQMYKVDHG